jgi:XapX domain-containing protein
MFEPLAGLLMAFAIGACCRRFDIPSPAPPKLAGALLVVAMTIGFLLTERIIGVH